jgi:protease-4
MAWFRRSRARKQLARIEISGAIANGTRKQVLKALKTVEERKYPGLLLRVDSPGGTVGDSQEIYDALKRLREKCKTKVVVSCGNISASGGVYISMGADQIMANPGTITGSIGVILRGNNLERLLDKVGVSFKVIKSGPYKDILSFDRELTPEEQHILQNLIDSSYDQFVQAVAQGRNLPEEKVRSFADGRIFTGQQALELGMVDRLGSEEDARCWLAELVGLDPDRVQTINIEEPKKPVWQKVLSGQGPVMRTAIDLPLLRTSLQWLAFELETSGQPLWLYRP